MHEIRDYIFVSDYLLWTDAGKDPETRPVPTYSAMGQGSLDKMSSFIEHRLRADSIEPTDIDQVDKWLASHIHELKDPDLIDSYLLEV